MNYLYQKYWEERMQQRMQERFETYRLLMTLKGFFLERTESEQKEWSFLSDFYRESGRPYGNKNIAESIAFHLGWDIDRVLCESTLPEFVEKEAMKLHSLVGKEIKKEEEFAAKRLACKQKENISE